MLHGILGNMQLCPVLYLTELGVGLQLDGAGDIEWQGLARKIYARGRRRGIKTG